MAAGIPSKLIQTEVPETAHKAAADLAAKEGLSLRTWLKRLVLDKVGYDGLGKKIGKR